MTGRTAERDLKSDERRIVERLLVPLGGDAAPYLAQLDNARVESACTCGCPSVKFVPGPAGTGVAHPIADGRATSPEGHEVGVILFARDGRLVELEFYANSVVGKFATPAVESVKDWSEESG